MTPDILMILAAGRGKRMLHLTNDKPKPLVSVLGKTLLDRVIEHANSAHISKIVINTCYLGQMIEDSVAGKYQTPISFSREAEALETGGGVLNALPLLLPTGENGFFVANADPLWVDKTTSVFDQLSSVWTPVDTDILLAFVPTSQAFGALHGGDYFIENGLPRRKQKGETAPYFFTGIQILHPRIFKGLSVQPFNLVGLYDAAQQAGRLKAIVYDGDWYHVGTPEALTFTEEKLSHD